MSAGSRRRTANSASAEQVSERTRLGVVGWPVAHSRSPQIQNAALRAVGLRDWRYQLLPVPGEVLKTTVRALPGAGFRGVNVTIPHKEAALALADRPSPVARAIGAANTLVFEDDGTISAENTDALALLDALPVPAAGVSVLVLGAGGSARAAVWALREAGAEVRIWNRTAVRAEVLAREFGVRVAARAEGADLLVNCTSIGLAGTGAELKQLPFKADEIGMFGNIVDFVYSASETELIHAGRAAGLACVDGLDLLVGQGALSFQHFTGLKAPVEEMRAAARAG
jgi:shikimate dehydrogenase